MNKKSLYLLSSIAFLSLMIQTSKGTIEEKNLQTTLTVEEQKQATDVQTRARIKQVEKPGTTYEQAKVLGNFIFNNNNRLHSKTNNNGTVYEPTVIPGFFNLLAPHAHIYIALSKSTNN